MKIMRRELRNLIIETLTSEDDEYSEGRDNIVFDNEFGNEIEIEVRDLKQEDFLGMDGEEPYDGVFIRMTGPNSETESMVTRIEAQNLLLMLQNYFKEDLIALEK